MSRKMKLLWEYYWKGDCGERTIGEEQFEFHVWKMYDWRDTCTETIIGKNREKDCIRSLST